VTGDGRLLPRPCGPRNVAVVRSDGEPAGGAGPPAAGAPATGLPAGAADGTLPAVPVSAGALIFDRDGRLLILKPTYKAGWTIPGGVMEAGGETPWQACRREVREECGLELGQGRLACMDFRPPRPGRPGGIRFLFDCGTMGRRRLAAIVLQPEEISDYRLAALAEALPLLRGPVRRRVRAACAGRGLVYLENGRPAPGVARGRPASGVARGRPAP